MCQGQPFLWNFSHPNHMFSRYHQFVQVVWEGLGGIEPQTLKKTYSFLGIWFWFWTHIEQLDKIDWTVKSVDLQKTVTHALSLPSVFCILTKRSVSVTPPPFPHACLTTLLLTQNEQLHSKKNLFINSCLTVYFNRNCPWHVIYRYISINLHSELHYGTLILRCTHNFWRPWKIWSSCLHFSGK